MRNVLFLYEEEINENVVWIGWNWRYVNFQGGGGGGGAEAPY